MKEGLINKKRNGAYVLENTALIGYDYLWRVRPKNISLICL